MLKSHLGSLAYHLHSNVCPTGSPSKYQDLLAIKLLWLPVFNNFRTQPWKSTTCNCDYESDFLHICRGPGFLEPQEQSSGHYKPWINGEWEDRTIQWDKGQSNPTTTAWYKVVEVCPVSSCFVVTSQPFLPGTTRSTLDFVTSQRFLIVLHPSSEYLSAELDEVIKEVGFCILFQVLQHLFGLLGALFNLGLKLRK